MVSNALETFFSCKTATPRFKSVDCVLHWQSHRTLLDQLHLIAAAPPKTACMDVSFAYRTSEAEVRIHQTAAATAPKAGVSLFHQHVAELDLPALDCKLQTSLINGTQV